MFESLKLSVKNMIRFIQQLDGLRLLRYSLCNIYGNDLERLKINTETRFKFEKIVFYHSKLSFREEELHMILSQNDSLENIKLDMRYCIFDLKNDEHK